MKLILFSFILPVSLFAVSINTTYYCLSLPNEEVCHHSIPCRWNNSTALCEKDSCFNGGYNISCFNGCSSQHDSDVNYTLCYNDTYHNDSTLGGVGSCCFNSWFEGVCDTSLCRLYGADVCLENNLDDSVWTILCDRLLNDVVCSHEIACYWSSNNTCVLDEACFQFGSSFTCKSGCTRYKDGNSTVCYNSSHHSSYNVNGSCSIRWWSTWKEYCNSTLCSNYDIACLEKYLDPSPYTPPPPSTPESSSSKYVFIAPIIVGAVIVLVIVIVIIFAVTRKKKASNYAAIPDETIERAHVSQPQQLHSHLAPPMPVRETVILPPYMYPQGDRSQQVYTQDYDKS